MTAREVIFEIMKILADPAYVLDHPLRPAYEHDPWPIVRTAVAMAAIGNQIHREALKRLEEAEAKLAKLEGGQ